MTDYMHKPIASQGVVDQAILKRYIQYLRLEKSYTDNTLDAYKKDLEKLLVYYRQEGIDPRQVTIEQLDQFAGWLIEQQIQPRSVARILSGVRSFYRFLTLEKEVPTDPTELLETPKRGKHLPTVLSLEEIDAIMEAVDMSKPEANRDLAFLEVLYSCGLRVSELCGLRISDLFLEEGFIRVHGKGRKERLVPIGQVAISRLRTWFVDRQTVRVRPGHEDYVFVSLTRGRALSRITIFYHIKQLAQAAGIQKEISPHTFRHSFATHLLQGGANLRAIQAMLGHESIVTTEIYMHVDDTHLREEVLMHHPRNIRYREQGKERQEES